MDLYKTMTPKNTSIPAPSIYKKPTLQKTTANAPQLKRMDGTFNVETPAVLDAAAPVSVVDPVFPDAPALVEVGAEVSVAMLVALPVEIGASRAVPVIGAAFRALNGAGVMTLEYPGNNFSVILAAPKFVKPVPGKFDSG